MRLCSIASGSSGNCIYTGTDHTHLLIDTGISKKRIEEGLHDLEIKGEEIDGILITHEHSDHIQGLGVFSRKYEVPIYGTPGTLNAVKKSKSLGKILPELFREIHTDEPFTLGDVQVEPFAISHDAAEPCGYRMQCGWQEASRWLLILEFTMIISIETSEGCECSCWKQTTIFICMSWTLSLSIETTCNGK